MKINSKVYVVCEDHSATYFNYERQAWVKDGRYIRCGHPEGMHCGCYGKLHVGEKVSA